MPSVAPVLLLLLVLVASAWCVHVLGQELRRAKHRARVRRPSLAARVVLLQRRRAAGRASFLRRPAVPLAHRPRRPHLTASS